MSTYALDGHDLKIELGFDVESIEGLESIPGRKGETFHSWDDENGIVPYVDADDIVLKERIFTIKMYLLATSVIDAQAKLEALEDILYSEGHRTFVVSYVTGSYSCFCKEGIVSERITNAISAVVAYRVSFKLVECN